MFMNITQINRPTIAQLNKTGRSECINHACRLTSESEV